MRELLLAFIFVLSLASCSVLTDFFTSAVTQQEPLVGIETEIENVDGGKTETIETNVGDSSEQNVDATTVGEVSSEKQEANTIVNNDLSPNAMRLIVGLFLCALLFWALPTPNRMWARFKQWRQR